MQNLLSFSLLSKDLKIKIYITIILPVVLYECETWSLTMREECRLTMFKNRRFINFCQLTAHFSGTLLPIYCSLSFDTRHQYLSYFPRISLKKKDFVRASSW